MAWYLCTGKKYFEFIDAVLAFSRYRVIKDLIGAVVRLSEIALADPEFEGEKIRSNDKRSMLRQIAHALGAPEGAFLNECEAFATIDMTGELLRVWYALTVSDRRLLLEMARGMISRG